MPKLSFSRQKRRIKKFIRTNTSLVAVVGVLLGCVGVVIYAQYMQPKRLSVDPATYQPLLQLIARVESKDNYNAYFGHAHNTSVQFTAMSIGEVLQWQAQFVAEGNASSAVGRYQLIEPTLRGLVHELGLAPTQKFDQPTQDRLAVALLERRGAEKYVNRELTQHEFAANLAKEWAALPRVVGSNPAASYYAGDGLNQALVPVDHVLEAIEPIRARQ